MKEYTLRFGDVASPDNFPANYVDAKSYRTAQEPVVAWEMQTLAGTTERLVTGWKHALEFRTHAMPRADAKRLASLLQTQPLSVTFTSLQTGADVTAEMLIDEISYGHLLSNGGELWLSGAAIKLRQK